MNNDKELIPSLFRTEYSKMVSVLCRSFGLSNIELAQDIVSDTFLKASETWGLKGVPSNPKAWLYSVAKNRAKDHFKRTDILRNKVTPYLVYHHTVAEELELSFTSDHLNDSLLSMMFVICNPILSIESQLSLGLRILCGFNIDEIANALLCSKSVINKRLSRAKQKLREHNIGLEFPSSKAIENRQQSVLHMLYLLFNEGYCSTNVEQKIREDLCYEAMRLSHLITLDKRTNTPSVNAMLALFCFHASRFEARIDTSGNQILYEDQNHELWNKELIRQGEYYLNLSGDSTSYSRYHFEALIAFWHTRVDIKAYSKWEKILALYDDLIKIDKSPAIKLNRTFALGKVRGKKSAIKQALELNLHGYTLYHSLLANLYEGIDTKLQRAELKKAIETSKNNNDKLLLQKKLDKLAD